MAPLVVGIGGSISTASVSNRLLRTCLDRAAELGAETRAFDGSFLAALPIFSTTSAATDEARELATAVRAADAVLLATPGYHGSLSGLVKNALDHLELLREDDRPYLEGRAVGVIVAAAGWQACGTALVSVRSIIHALRGWPTPLGVTVNSVEQHADENGQFEDRVEGALAILAGQLVEFAGWQAVARSAG
jgi:FMN reductase